jgi:branched-chain amino acid transport system ATP-binding protein
MLKITNLIAGYGKFPVLKGIDLEVDNSEIGVLIGPNGAGKSTVLKSIFGLAEIQSGSIIFKVIDLKTIERHDLIKIGLSYVPQGRIVFTDLTVRENLLLGGLDLDSDLVSVRMNQIIEEFPVLKKKINTLADKLSGGEQQILALARGLISLPQLLLLDEPSLGLAPKIQDYFFKKLVQLKEKGLSILLVEQNAKKACEIADKVCLLENGKIVLSGGKEILQNPILKKVYLGG